MAAADCAAGRNLHHLLQAAIGDIEIACSVQRHAIRVGPSAAHHGWYASTGWDLQNFLIAVVGNVQIAGKINREAARLECASAGVVNNDLGCWVGGGKLDNLPQGLIADENVASHIHRNRRRG